MQNGDLLDRITETTSRREEIRNLVKQICFTLGKGKNEYPSSLQLVLEQEERIEVVPYAYIQHTHYNRPKGIILSSVGSIITIYGKHMDTLFNLMIERKISHIVPAPQPIPSNMQHNPEIALVTKIDVVYKDPQIEKHIDAM